MYYNRKIVILAIAGAVATGVVLSNREIVSRLVGRFHHRQQIVKLKAWYEAYLVENDEYVGMNVEQYLEDQKDDLQRIAKEKGYSDKATKRFKRLVAADVRELILADQRRQVTKKYADYLYEVDRNRGLRADRETKECLVKAGMMADKLRAKGLNPDTLFISLRITPPD